MAIDTLSPYTRPRGEFGPTQTQTAQKSFAQRLRGVLGRINAAIRRGIIKEDIFSLREGTDTLAVDDPGPFETDSRPQKIAQFVAWLREQLQTEFLTVVGPDRNEFILQAYAAGIRNANRQLSELDVSFVPADMDELLGRPIHRSSLQELYTRTYENLQSVADDMAEEVRQELIEGFRDGENPTKIARRLNERIDSIGKHRATMIARSEVINSHSEGTLTRIDEADRQADEDVVVRHGQWDAANDSRTCAFCRALDGTSMSTDEMRNNSVEVIEEIGENFLGRTFRLKPPAHVQGRCNIRVMIGSTPDKPLDERLPDQITVN